MIEIKNLRCGYGRAEIIKGVTLAVGSGEFLGLVGPNGSGKTTLLRAMSRTLAPASGAILLEGRDIYALSPRAVARRIAVVSSEIALDFSFTVGEVALMGRTPHVSPLGWETKGDFEAARRAMEMVGVLPLADKLITEISSGERQRAFLALALAQEPVLLLADEPTSHLDLCHQVGISDLMRRLNREHGLTVVTVSHDLNLAAEYCSRLVMLKDGAVKFDGNVEEVVTEERIREVYGAAVRVTESPATGKPHVSIIPASQG